MVKRKSRFLATVLLLALVFTAAAMPASAATAATATHYTYFFDSQSTSAKCLNVYSDGVPSSTNAVTCCTYSGSNYQRWVKVTCADPYDIYSFLSPVIKRECYLYCDKNEYQPYARLQPFTDCAISNAGFFYSSGHKLFVQAGGSLDAQKYLSRSNATAIGGYRLHFDQNESINSGIAGRQTVYQWRYITTTDRSTAGSWYNG